MSGETEEDESLPPSSPTRTADAPIPTPPPVMAIEVVSPSVVVVGPVVVAVVVVVVVVSVVSVVVVANQGKHEEISVKFVMDVLMGDESKKTA